MTTAVSHTPKRRLRDWSRISDEGKRAETFIACHLLKAVEGRTDLGIGDFKPGYLRDKAKREVDFIVLRDQKPWIPVEAKKSDDNLSPSLSHYQQQTGAPYAFQVIKDYDFVDADCLAQSGHPMIIPSRTYLSQLL